VEHIHIQDFKKLLQCISSAAESPREEEHFGHSMAVQTPMGHNRYMLQHDLLLRDIRGQDDGQSNKRTKAPANAQWHHKQGLRDSEEKRRRQKQLAEEFVINLSLQAEDQRRAHRMPRMFLHQSLIVCVCACISVYLQGSSRYTTTQSSMHTICQRISCMIIWMCYLQLVALV